VRCWDARTGTPLGPLLPHPFDARAAAVSPDGKIAYTGCLSMQQKGGSFVPKGEVFRWDASSGASLGRLLEVPMAVRSIALVRNGHALFIDSAHGCALFDAASGKALGAPLKPDGVRIDHAAASPDGRRIVIASHIGNSARLWDLESGQPVGPTLQHPDWVQSVAFSPDGRTIATGCKDKVARLWDAVTGTPTH